VFVRENLLNLFLEMSGKILLPPPRAKLIPYIIVKQQRNYTIPVPGGHPAKSWLDSSSFQVDNSHDNIQSGRD
jgi:hypothetical protein